MDNVPKVLLIGGTGFIGQNLAYALLKRGYMVTSYARKPLYASFERNINYRFIEGDFFVNGEKNLSVEGYDYVFFLVCSMSPAVSKDRIIFGYEEDVSGLLILLEKVRIAGGRLIFISSGGTVYGNSNEKLLTENMQTFPINNYGILKLTQEKIITMYNIKYGMQNVVFRVSNPYGHGQRRDSGIGAVTTFLDSIITGNTIKIYGDGNNVRDYIAITDVVEIIINFVEKHKKIDEVPIYNIGTGVGTSLNELVDLLHQITSESFKVEYYDSRDVDVKKNVLSIDKIKNVIGNYSFIPLRKGLIMYYKELKRDGEIT